MTPDSLALAHHAGFWLGFWLGAPVFVVAGIVLGALIVVLLARHHEADEARGFDDAMLVVGPATRVIRFPRSTATQAQRERRAVRKFVEARRLV